MSQYSPHPRKSLRSELFPVIAVVFTILFLAAVFPYPAVFHVPRAETRERGACRFVKLSAEESSAVMAAARAAVKTSGKGRLGSLRPDISLDAIPESTLGNFVTLSSDFEPPKAAPMRYREPLFPPTRAAREPEAFAPIGEGGEEPAFTRENMLTIKE